MNNNIPEAINVLNANMGKLEIKDQQFAVSLCAQYASGRGLSDKQGYWAMKLADRATGKEAALKAVQAAPVTLNVLRIVKMFDTAAAALKRPKIMISDSTFAGVKINVAGERSKYCGQLMLTNGAKWGEEGRVYYGRIDQLGCLFLSREGAEAGEALVSLLKRFAEAPEAVAAEHGKLTGCCSFCGRGLEDDRSTTVGYGPVCAKRYGLQWGSSAAAAAAAIGALAPAAPVATPSMLAEVQSWMNDKGITPDMIALNPAGVIGRNKSDIAQDVLDAERQLKVDQLNADIIALLDTASDQQREWFLQMIRRVLA